MRTVCHLASIALHGAAISVVGELQW